MTQSPTPPNYIAESQNGTVNEWTACRSGASSSGY